MKNKYGLLGFLSLIGFLGFQSENRLFLFWFCNAVFFQYFWIIPDELFKETLKNCAAAAFFVHLAITTVSTSIIAIFGLNENPFAAGIIWGFTGSLCTFTFSTTILEWKQRRGINDD